MASAALVTAGLTAPAALASAPNATCTGQLPRGTYQNVTVPAQATCEIIQATIITGDVTVATGAELSVNMASIGGNLQADHAQVVTVVLGSVGGNLQLTATSIGNAVCGVRIGNDLTVQNSAAVTSLGDCIRGLVNVIGGNLTVQNNAGNVTASGNLVTGNISVHNNTGGGRLIDNSAGGSCQLFNDNPPITGASNTAPTGHQNTCNGSA
jgi:hypothetical protein